REREEARKKRDFRTADEKRDRIREMGWAVEDGKDGPRFRRLKS
ncbi:MAG: CysS/YqeB C-terminal domain-containing protein, partial [Planctomycetota bacterium]